MLIVVPARLTALNDRLQKRFSYQPEAPDLLPEPNSDLEKMAQTLVDVSDGPRPGKRSDMFHQVKMLSRSLAGRSTLELQHAIAISYLRRDTPYTEKAWGFFQRVWSEQADFMTEQLSIRWIISSLQTFYDHSDVPGERSAGGLGFVYGNLIKIYETEHHARRRNKAPDPSGFKNKSVHGMFGFKPGDDIMINLNVLMLDAAKSGGRAGKPLLRLMTAIADGNTIFQRTDALAEVEPFSEHPSFTLSFDGRK